MIRDTAIEDLIISFRDIEEDLKIQIFYCFSTFGTILIGRFRLLFLVSVLSLLLLKDPEFLRNLFLFFLVSVLSLFLFSASTLWNRKSPNPHHIQPPNSTHIIIDPYPTMCSAVRVSVLIWITVLDLEPNPDFQIFLNISVTNDQIFNCNISKHSSGQELPFIFFELRAPTCL